MKKQRTKYYAFALLLYKKNELLPQLASFQGTIDEFSNLKDNYWKYFEIEVLIYDMKQMQKKDLMLPK